MKRHHKNPKKKTNNNNNLNELLKPNTEMEIFSKI